MGNPNEARRRASSKALILAALREAGPRGCSNRDLNDIAFRYGGRLEELRTAGHDIESIDEGGGWWRYVLHEPARIKPGTPGFLASLPAVASITGRAIPAPAVPDSAPGGNRTLFDL